MVNFLLEIGTEELPLASLNVVYEHFAQKVKEGFRKNRLSFGDVKMEATPRRIALYVEDLAARQENQILELMGPLREKAYDGEGKPTPALEGFLRSKKAALSDVVFKETPKGVFVSIRQKLTGRPAGTVLPAILNEAVAELPFPKLMRWEASGFRFPRPVRWLVALLDQTVIPFSMAGVKAGKTSYGHRFLSPHPFSIRKAEWKTYKTLLRQAHVILTLEERKNRIKDGLVRQFGQRDFDEDLLHTTAQLVEEPFLFRGSFSKTYLELPPEVLASCMKKNQKIFACYDARGRMINRFVAVMNGKRRGLPRIRFDYENVLESRLRDARYFYEADTREPLENRLPLLDQLAYLGKLGSMRDKTERLEKMAGSFCEFLGRLDLRDSLGRAARLSKADLMTQMVYEFPDLQGIVGREYALEAGEQEAVAGAVGSQYLPKNLGENYRDLSRHMTPLGAMLGIIDRMDLLVGAFGTGIEPTGSQDPYALRRAGGSLVKIIRTFGFHFSLTEMIEKNADFYGGVLQIPKNQLVKKLKDFLKERLLFEMGFKSGTRDFEILQAVFVSSSDDFADVCAKYGELESLLRSDHASFFRAAKVVERTANILKGIGHFDFCEIKPELFQSDLERDLFRLIEEKGPEVASLLTKRDYERATVHFGGIFFQPLNQFFGKILVNAEDPAVRCNRHLLMLRINRMYVEKLADLSLLSRSDQE
jgi:glycyl-tRNA synthetase beta chain